MTLTLFDELDARSELWQYRCLFSGSARYLARREVRSFSGSEGALRGGRNRREVIPQRDRTHERILYRARSRQHPPHPPPHPPPPPPPPLLIASLDTLRVERSVSFQALLDSFHVERPASFQALLCSSARAESSSLVLRYFARRLAFFFS